MKKLLFISTLFILMIVGISFIPTNASAAVLMDEPTPRFIGTCTYCDFSCTCGCIKTTCPDCGNRVLLSPCTLPEVKI